MRFNGKQEILEIKSLLLSNHRKINDLGVQMRVLANTLIDVQKIVESNVPEKEKEIAVLIDKALQCFLHANGVERA